MFILCLDFLGSALKLLSYHQEVLLLTTGRQPGALNRASFGSLEPGIANEAANRAQPGMAGNQAAGSPGQARPGLARPGLARRGQAWPGQAWPGLARPGLARPGLARPGFYRAWQATGGQAPNRATGHAPLPGCLVA